MDTSIIERFDPSDVVAMARCTVIDVDAFPYASSRFGQRRPSDRTWIARRQGGVEGFLAARVVGEVLLVHGLAVARTARKRGVGRALVHVAVACSIDEGLSAVKLNVWVGNAAAVALYRSEGFAVLRRLPAFYPAGAFDGSRDAFAMVLALPPVDAGPRRT